MVYVVLSHYDNYVDRVEKIKNDGLEVDYFYVEDYLETPEKYNLSEKDVIYFLNNSDHNLEFIEKAEKTNCKIINIGYYKNNLSKLGCQKALSDGGVKVPEIINFKDITKRDFPLFCKAYQHADIVMKMYTLSTFENIISKFNVEDLYFERSVDKGDYKEFKVYFIKDDIYFDDKYGEFYDEEIQKICLKVRDVLGLDVYSTDIILSAGEYYVLDINPCAGLYNSKASRRALIRGF